MRGWAGRYESSTLVHYTVADLTPILSTNTCDWDISDRQAQTIGTIGTISYRYEPWGYSQTGRGTTTDLRVKDPGVTQPDVWAFPSGPPFDAASLGQVHRGTAWQTLYLKSSAVDTHTWQAWTGSKDADAWLMHPTNDWRHVSILAPLFNTNAALDLSSVNQPNPGAWAALMDGLTVWTSASSQLVISSNSPGTAVVADALDTLRLSEPGGWFTSLGEILAAPQLSVDSPWGSTISYGLTDAVVEALPAQLLSRLRPDSIARTSQENGEIRIRFTGADAYSYEVQVSTNLVNWATLSTNNPSNGVFDYVEAPSSASPNRFLRSVLIR